MTVDTKISEKEAEIILAALTEFENNTANKSGLFKHYEGPAREIKEKYRKICWQFIHAKEK